VQAARSWSSPLSPLERLRAFRAELHACFPRRADALFELGDALLAPTRSRRCRTRAGAWLGGWRRLRIRYERSAERFYALVMLACSVICFNTLRQPPW
jgi:transposase